MNSLTSEINVQVDSKVYDQANDILERLGLDMNTYINMVIKQLIYNNGIPFDIAINNYND